MKPIESRLSENVRLPYQRKYPDGFANTVKHVAEGLYDVWQNKESVGSFFTLDTDLKQAGKDVLKTGIKAGLTRYFRAVHDIQLQLHEQMPTKGPYIAVFHHTSVFDTPILMVVDPYEPSTTPMAKKSMVDAPVVGHALKLWDTVPFARQGTDTGSLRKINRILKAKHGLAVATSGRRSRDPEGRMEPHDRLLIQLLIKKAEEGTELFAVGIDGAYEILPAEKKIPNLDVKVRVKVNKRIDLSKFFGKRLTEEDLIEASKIIRESTQEVTPERYHPREGMKELWSQNEYVLDKPKKEKKSLKERFASMGTIFKRRQDPLTTIAA